MSIARSFANDVFISYCHAENHNAMGRGWIEVFHDELKMRLIQIVGARQADEQPAIWRDVRLQGNDEFPAVLTDELRRAALVVSVLTPRYVGSTWCQTEVATFCQLAQQTGGLRVANKLRILKVLKTPVDQARHPSMLKDAIGFPFYVMDPERAIPREFTLSETVANHDRAKQAINDLAYSILALPAAAATASAAATPLTTPAAIQPVAGHRRRSADPAAARPGDPHPRDACTSCSKRATTPRVAHQAMTCRAMARRSPWSAWSRMPPTPRWQPGCASTCSTRG